MKPSKTSHITRAILKEISCVTELDHNGLYVISPEFPDVNLPTDRFREEWLGYNIARKRVVENDTTEQAAREGFLASELKCAAIEKSGLFADLLRRDLRVVLRARQIMFDLLGDAPPDDWFQYCEFTGGASTSRNRSESHPAMKWIAGDPLHVTPLALEHLLSFKASCEAVDVAWSDPGILSAKSYYRDNRLFYTVVPGSRLAFVEKNYKTKRTILIEPDGNMLLQKGVGTSIRRCLKRVGINLNSQRLNQYLAKVGSILGSLGTVDIAAASDSVTLCLLRFLLPWKWYKLIYELRSPLYKDGDKWSKMHKVSSMGNGFTFELESAVFYCIAKAVIDVDKPEDGRIAIFGDDIIIASECCDRLTHILGACGFAVNTDKSFWTGPFRESCGKHYHSGADVTPVYIKEDLDLQQSYRLYNQVRAWAGGEFFDHRYSRLLESILVTIPLRDRIQVPLEYDALSGLYYPDVCTVPIRHRIHRGGHFVTFECYRRETRNYTERYEDEVLWLYRHVSRWTASCPLGTDEYTPLVFQREFGYKRVKVSVPCSSVTVAIA